MSDIMNQAGDGLKRSGAGFARIKEMHMRHMEDIEKHKQEINRINSAEYKQKLKDDAEELFKPVADYINYLEQELEEAKQEIASLQQCDCIERGAE